MKDSWLSKNVRPLTLVSLTLCLMCLMFSTAYNTEKMPNLQSWLDIMTTLCTVVYAAYFGGRSFEKHNVNKSSD